MDLNKLEYHQEISEGELEGYYIQIVTDNSPNAAYEKSVMKERKLLEKNGFNVCSMKPKGRHSTYQQAMSKIFKKVG